MSLLVKTIAAPFKLYNSIADEVAKERRLRLTDGAAWSARPSCRWCRTRS